MTAHVGNKRDYGTDVHQPLLRVDEVRKEFRVRSGGGRQRVALAAVDGVTFEVGTSRTTALVGESGSGKSTLARLIMGVYRPDRGSISMNGKRIDNLRRSALREHRRSVQMVFQNPLLSFDPALRIGTSVREVARLSCESDATDARRIEDLLSAVGLTAGFAQLRPRQVSGGELQRAAIARAISALPELVVLDEPTSSLDVSIRGQVLSVLQGLQRERKIAYLIATHDLKLVRLMSDRVLVMYLGQIVEDGPTDSVINMPRHPYTAGLIDAEASSTSPQGRASIRIAGSVVRPEPSYKGCRLVGRCPLAVPQCAEPQPLVEVSPGHHARCWRSSMPLPITLPPFDGGFPAKDVTGPTRRTEISGGEHR